MRPLSSLFLVIYLGLSALTVIGFGVPSATAAETIKVGTLKLRSYSPLFIAKERGYFAAEGLDTQLVYFDSGEPVAVALASGAIDFGVVGTSAGLFQLAGQGAIRIIGGNQREVPGDHAFGILASNRAFDAGLKSYKDIASHSFGVTQIGGPTHYALVLVAQKFAIDLNRVRVVPFQSIPNLVSALKGGQVDAGGQSGLIATQMIEKGDAKLLGWASDDVQWQFSALITGTKTADQRSDTVRRFLSAFKRGARDYWNAFSAPDRERQPSADGAVILAIDAKYTGLSPEVLQGTMSYLDADAWLDADDILKQVTWYKSQGMVKGDFDPNSIIDKRYAIAPTGR